jgi:Flp pilus assembly protein TadG
MIDSATIPALRRRDENLRCRAYDFLRKCDGGVAIEFAMVALPFFALVFAILETAIVFFAGQALQVAAADSGRLIMTGQAQQANYTRSDFKNQVCARIYGLFNCASSMTVDVKNYSTFGNATTGVASAPTTYGVFDGSKTGYTLGGPGCIQVVTLYYQWPVYIPLLRLNYLGNNSRLLQATAVFKNEPYSTSGTC